MQIYWTKINKIIEETPEVKTYLLDCPENFTWEEGSHVHFALKGFNDGDKPNRNLIRHMSISTIPQENVIGITTRIKEQCSEFKSILLNLEVGDEVAIFKIHSNVPLKRADKNVYLLSSGVGLATFRPLVLDYFERADNVNQIHSLNIDSSKDFLFPTIFESAVDKNFTAQFVDNRKDYYKEVKKLVADKDGLFYIVGSNEFLLQNIAVLREQGIKPEHIMLDKHEQQLPDFLPSI
ncbi:dihydropteridine reductase [Staphylococcus nepalensis]|jgi:ferredoxin--NADP+ reductase|uniref:Dihydropteridine reductase n=1 Tax=Staphylococcus nepalensis TaxID=214473 RepID=A0A2T4S9L8_9STAP|nr:dihydropteridine reductase [Staphylococcus nepalensis]VDG65692.1 bifunctional nitric oxide dioxygenase/dihydropteridine reductase 2 [Lacrimispora indolis]MBO1206196.1 dihydropteridine reductase [Staphylococcus nepalensis]MBO1212169.1 dihydropteridine reductase [Staphylococcus nepalensis]MBO1216879.1 dihydropteridine reductase [Staphylococcus nepalensis]MBO1228407.1 dihydropteridine reductase [Staphylococcus nepalensis]